MELAAARVLRPSLKHDELSVSASLSVRHTARLVAGAAKRKR
jgi:predicted thioesterase